MFEETPKAELEARSLIAEGDTANQGEEDARLLLRQRRFISFSTSICSAR